MPLTLNIHQVEKQGVSLQGELSVAEMEWDTRDALIQVSQPLHYQLHFQRLGKSLLAQGALRQVLDCACVRCLKVFSHEVKLETWSCLLELEEEEKVALINDCVDLTPYVRDDIFLASPQHPLCGPQCKGLAVSPKDATPGGSWASGAASTAWAELDKLKLE